jgi:hypothetical protein
VGVPLCVRLHYAVRQSSVARVMLLGCVEVLGDVEVIVWFISTGRAREATFVSWRVYQ